MSLGTSQIDLKIEKNKTIRTFDFNKSSDQILQEKSCHVDAEFNFIYKIEEVFVACHRKSNLKVHLQRQMYGPSRYLGRKYTVWAFKCQEFRIVFHRTFFDMESKTKTQVQLFCLVLRICPVEISICVSVFEHFC